MKPFQKIQRDVSDARQKANAELMVLDALRTFTQTTQRRIRSIDFDFESEPDGTQKIFSRVTLHLDGDNT